MRNSRIIRIRGNMKVCQWFNNSELQMEVTKVDNIYFLNGEEIDKEIACKIINLNYESAKEICNE